jgi:hypothetical protein
VVLKTEDEEELEIAEDETKEELAEELVEVIWLSAEVLVELEELLLLLEVETTSCCWSCGHSKSHRMTMMMQS